MCLVAESRPEKAVMNIEQTLSREIAGQKQNSVFCFSSRLKQPL